MKLKHTSILLRHFFNWQQCMFTSLSAQADTSHLGAGRQCTPLDAFFSVIFLLIFYNYQSLMSYFDWVCVSDNCNGNSLFRVKNVHF